MPETSVNMKERTFRHRDRLSQVPIYLGKQFRFFINESDWKVIPMAAVIAGLVSVVIRSRIFASMEGCLIGSFALTCVALRRFNEADAYYEKALSWMGKVKNGELEQQLKENDAYWDGLREGYENFLKQDISEEEKEGLMQQLADIERNKAQSRNDILQQFQLLKKEAGEMNKEINPADITPERLYTLKKSIRKNVIGKKIWGFDRVRDFRNGFAAVCYSSDEDFGDRWGFVNREGRLAIPCVWNYVYNFNNHRPYSLNFRDHTVDEDYRPWTSVQKDNLIGMIDTTGTVKVPVKFRYSKRPQLVFRATAKGEVAPARDAKSGKWGLINRKGDWKVKPVYEGLDWDGESTGLYYWNKDGVEKQLTL